MFKLLKYEHIIFNSKNIGRRALFSYRAQYDVIEFSNCHTEERSEAEFFCAVWKRNGVIPYSITEQSTTSYVLTVIEHSYIQGDVIACTVLCFHNGE